jgi:hypothetical protein
MDQHAATADDDLWGPPAPPATPSPEAGAAGGGRAPARKWIAAVVGTAAVAVAAFVGANIASSGTQNLGAAGPGGGGGPGGFRGPGGGRGNAGTIARIDGSTIKMTTEAGATVSVTTSAATTVSISSTGRLADVRVGDNVRVAGTTSGATLAADQITDSGTSPLADLPAGRPQGAPPAGANGPAPAGPNANGNGGGPPAGGARPQGGGGGPAGAGVVKSVSGSTFTIATADGSTLTVNTSASTTVTVVKPGTLASLRAGDAIQVTGQPGSDGTIAATSIRSGAVGPQR